MDRQSLSRPGAAAAGVVRAGIVVTGTEVLTGRIADRNGPWISERLAELGIEVAHIQVVGDRPADLEAALRFMAAEGMDLIVTSGGLGPTADDLTAEIVARFAGREMSLDEGMEAKIAAILAEFARRFDFDVEALREANRKQAMVPDGAVALDPVGTAPGLVVPADGRVVIVLPGPPRELQPMWPTALGVTPVRDVVARATPLHGYTLRMFGIPESEIAKSLREIEAGGTDLSAVEITTCLRRGEIEIDVRYREEASDVAERIRTGLAERHRRHLFSAEGETIDAQLSRLLRGRRLALAESCSGGLLAARLTDLPGASSYFAGAVVAYSNEAKTELLGVDSGLIERHGAVSAEVAEAMSRGALERFGADVAVAITGIAGPSGGSDEKPIGYVCLDARLADGTELARDPVIPGGRADVRERSALVGMHMLRTLLSGEEAPL
ncbi:MAG TPA: competence/damage-inducible protein A [Solirubrobacterales bacterium]|nr:competence/damage-inducible protein A [Solirubrobacterales bacterium]